MSRRRATTRHKKRRGRRAFASGERPPIEPDSAKASRATASETRARLSAARLTAPRRERPPRRPADRVQRQGLAMPRASGGRFADGRCREGPAPVRGRKPGCRCESPTPWRLRQRPDRLAATRAHRTRRSGTRDSRPRMLRVRGLEPLRRRRTFRRRRQPAVLGAAAPRRLAAEQECYRSEALNASIASYC